MTNPGAYIVDRRLGAFCTADEFAASLEPDAVLHCLTRGEAIGLTIAAEAGYVSLAAVLALGAMILRNRYRGRKIIDSPLDVYMAGLFSAELVQALGIVMDTRWILEGKLFVGTYCNAEGALRQVGEAGVAMISLALAVHTFIVLWTRRRPKHLLLPAIIISAIWLYLVVFVGISIARHPSGSSAFEKPDPFWCWISPSYTVARVLGQYLAFWLAALVSLVLYALLFFLARGNITTYDTWWKFTLHARNESDWRVWDSNARARYGIMAYPVVYALMVLPLSIARWTTFTNKSAQSATMFTAMAIFGLSGVFNVALVLTMRPGLLGFHTRDAGDVLRGGAPSIADSERYAACEGRSVDCAELRG